MLLAQIAYESFEQDQLFFLKDDITRRIGEFLADTLDAPKHLDGAAVLRAIERQQGILVERATDIYSFSHLTLQEYLTAFHIKEEGLEAELIAHHLTDERWREVFLLVAGLMGNKAINFLAAMEAASRTYIAQYPKIIALVQCAETSTAGVASLVKLFDQRDLAIAIVIVSAIANNTYFLAHPLSSALDSAFKSASESYTGSALVTLPFESALDRANTLNRASAPKKASASLIRASALNRANDLNKASASPIFAQIFSGSKFVELPNQLNRMVRTVPDDHASSEVWHTWADELETLWLKAFGLAQEDLTFDEAEAEALQNYLYATELLLRCKEAAIRIPKQAWAELEDRLLTYHS